MRSKILLPSLALLLLAEPASAHDGAGTVFSFQSGFLHPLGGLDHLLAMFAVGLLAAQLGGRAIWLVPAAFIAIMIAGALTGFSGLSVPGFELAIVVSVVAIALLLAFARRLPVALAMSYVGFFALFHGYAHGAELPVGASAVPFIAGFALATSLVHAAGAAAGLAFARLRTGRLAA